MESIKPNFLVKKPVDESIGRPVIKIKNLINGSLHPEILRNSINYLDGVSSMMQDPSGVRFIINQLQELSDVLYDFQDISIGNDENGYYLRG